MILTGIGDEGANTIDGQIRAARELGWRYIEMRGVEVPGFKKDNLHNIPDAAFDIVVRKLEESGVGVYCFGSTVMNWAKTIATPFDVTLAQVKAEPFLKDMDLVRLSRLSVGAVKEKEYKKVLKMGGL